MFKERCGIKHETITVVSLLFMNLVIHCHYLAPSNCVFSALINKGQDNEDKAPSNGDCNKNWGFPIVKRKDEKKIRRTETAIRIGNLPS